MAIHKSLSFNEYKALRGLNFHGLKDFAKSPRNYQFWQEHPATADTEAFALGRLAHTAILEGVEAVTSRYLVWTGGRRAGAEWNAYKTAAEAEGKEIVKADDLKEVERMFQAVADHPKAGKVLGAITEVETSYTWEVRGTACKARIDAFCAKQGILVDLKTTADPREGFERQFYNLKYHWQAAWYMRALEANGVKVKGFLIIAVEKAPPYEVVCYQVDADTIALARMEMEPHLAFFDECRAQNRWPGYSDAIIKLQAPEWAFNRTYVDREILEEAA